MISGRPKTPEELKNVAEQHQAALTAASAVKAEGACPFPRAPTSCFLGEAFPDEVSSMLACTLDIQNNTVPGGLPNFVLIYHENLFFRNPANIDFWGLHGPPGVVQTPKIDDFWVPEQ